jgi:hypothetical protein
VLPPVLPPVLLRRVSRVSLCVEVSLCVRSWLK